MSLEEVLFWWLRGRQQWQVYVQCWLEVRDSCVFADLELEFGKAKLFFKIFLFPPFKCSSGFSLQMTVDNEIVQVTWMEGAFIFCELVFFWWFALHLFQEHIGKASSQFLGEITDNFFLFATESAGTVNYYFLSS